MNDQPQMNYEAQIAEWVASFRYPETPDIATAVSQHLQPVRRPRGYRLAWAALLLIFVVGGMMAVPPIRAAVLDFLQVGAVRIWRVDPTPAPTAEILPSLLNLAGETTLFQAEAQVDFPILLPTYPPDLGRPDKVYVQEVGGPVVVLIWLNEDRTDARLSLTILGSGSFAEKQSVHQIEETTVKGERAVWVTGAHLFQLRNGYYQLTRIVEGKTLIWTETYKGEILTYRLESDLSLKEAITIAESIANAVE